MHKSRNTLLGFGAISLMLVIVILVAIGAGGWVVYNYSYKQASSPRTSDTTSNNSNRNQTGNSTANNSADPTANWAKVDSIGGAYSIKVPDGWKLTSYPGNTINGDGLTFSAGTPATIKTENNPYAGDQRRFNVSFSEKRSGQQPTPQWQSPNPYGTETTEDFSIGSIKGTRFSIEYTQTVISVTKGDKIYDYTFFLPGGKGLGIVYIQYARDADNLKTVEQAIKTIVIN